MERKFSILSLIYYKYSFKLFEHYFSIFITAKRKKLLKKRLEIKHLFCISPFAVEIVEIFRCRPYAYYVVLKVKYFLTHVIQINSTLFQSSNNLSKART